MKRGMSGLTIGIISAVAVIILIAGYFYYQSPSYTAAPSAPSPQTQAPAPQTPTPTPPTQTPATHYDVTAANFAFSPSTLTIKQGDTVTWTNNDAATHTITSDAGSELSGTLSPGATYSHTFNAKGTFSYHCSIHTSMKGSIVVA